MSRSFIAAARADLAILAPRPIAAALWNQIPAAPFAFPAKQGEFVEPVVAIWPHGLSQFR
jgi:hypothetical protein